jgi:hypothetical protein
MGASPLPAPAVHQTIVGDHNIVTGTGDVRIVYQLPPAEAEERRALLVILERVRQFWIGGVLDGSLHGVAALELATAPDRDAVANPWSQVVELPAGASAAGLASLPIEGLYDQAGRALLILGAEGSGKTTALLQLARALLVRAERDPAQPVPVVLNLASWSGAGGTLLPWLVSELQSKYYVPPDTARGWITRQRLALLLDGLDEVEAERREACVAAINQHLREVGSPGLAVCSRLDEYRAQPERLGLGAAVRIEPLSAEQVAAYLASGGARLDGLRGALVDDDVLRDLATSPLLLSVMTLAYGDDARAPGPVAPDASAERRRARLFETYVQRMFARRGGGGARFDPGATLRWLGALANHMLREGQRVLLVEGLQPSWLAGDLRRGLYLLASRMLIGLPLGVMEGLYLYGLKHQSKDVRWAAVGFGSVMLAGILLGLGCGLVAGAADWVRFGRADPDRATREPWWRTAVVVAVHWATFTTLLAAMGADVGRGQFGIVWALFFALRSRGQSWRSDVRPVLGLAWSWRLALRGAVWGLLTALALGVFAAAVTGDYAAATAYLWLIFYAALGAAFGGVTRTVGAAAVPGRGIRLTLRAARRGGLLTGSVSGGLILCLAVVAMLLVWAISGVHPVAPLVRPDLRTPLVFWGFTLLAGAVLGGAVGVYFGLIGALWYGGADAIQHLVLRVLLRGAGVPWRLLRFLDHCARLIFLQRVGGGYRFVHGALMAHFAARVARAGERT